MLTVLDVMHMRRDADVEGLMSALQYQDDLAVRAEAAGALGQLGDPRACESLVATLEHDGDDYVRSVAATALGNLDDPRAREALLNALGSQASGEIIRAVVDAL